MLKQEILYPLIQQMFKMASPCIDRHNASSKLSAVRQTKHTLTLLQQLSFRVFF